MTSPDAPKVASNFMSKIRHSVIVVLWVFLFTIVSLELMLKAFDPWGADTYFYDLNTLASTYIPTNGHNILPDRKYTFRHWAATMQNGQRYSPDTPPDSACRIGVVGDSLTFGYGVNDDETWVNQLAKQNPQVRFENYGMGGANSENIRAVAEELDTDGIIYLFFKNDPGLPVVIPERQRGYQPAIAAYIHLVQVSEARSKDRELDPALLPERFINDIAYFDNLDNALILGFDDWYADFLAENYGLVIIPKFEEAISKTDAHPTPAEHRNIADDIQPYVKTLIADVCPALAESES